MSLRFPRGLRCVTESRSGGTAWRLFLDEKEVGAGVVADGKSEARRAAWFAAEEMGLVTDGVHS